jgi:translation initiation factor IF-1
MVSETTSSRRAILKTLVGSALLAATPLSVIEAAAKAGELVRFELQDGSKLSVRQVGKMRYRAVRMEGSKVVDKTPTGSFTLKTGEVVETKDGTITKADVPAGNKTRGCFDFCLSFSL